MPRTTYGEISIADYVQRLGGQGVAPHERISIRLSTIFNRGDEQNGVWSVGMKSDYIDSILKGYPVGQISLVKEEFNVNNNYSSAPCLILDGANKSRALRDFIRGLFTVRITVGSETQNCLFENMPVEIKAQFHQTRISVSTTIILATDPENAIAIMFTRLNTKQVKLQQGEYIKAFSWRKNHVIPELAKNIIGGPVWNVHIASGLSDGEPYSMPQAIVPHIERIETLRANWAASSMNELGDTARLDNFALVCGMSVAAHTHNINFYDKRFSRLENYLRVELTAEDVGDILSALEKFVEVMTEIYHETVFGRVTCGMPSKKFAAYVFDPIVSGGINEQQRNHEILRMRYYFAALRINTEEMTAFKIVCGGGGDNHNTASKFAQVRTKINRFISQLTNTSDSDNDSEEEIETY